MTLLRCEKAIRLLHFVFECTLFECVPPFGEIVFPYNLERLNNLLFCPLLFVFLLKSFFYSVVKDQRPTLFRVGSLRLLGSLAFHSLSIVRCPWASYSLSRLWEPVLPAGGDDGNRTHDPLLAGQVLSQLSYTPI